MNFNTKKSTILFDEKTDCWNWNRCKTVAGYGVLKLNGKQVYAHRLMYEKTGLKIPLELELDHLCRNPGCVNPDHLEAVTHRENLLRSPIQVAAINTKKTHCIRGHEFATHSVTKNGRRRCIVCRKTNKWWLDPLYKKQKALYDKKRRKKLK